MGICGAWWGVPVVEGNPQVAGWVGLIVPYLGMSTGHMSYSRTMAWLLTPTGWGLLLWLH